MTFVCSLIYFVIYNMFKQNCYIVFESLSVLSALSV